MSDEDTQKYGTAPAPAPSDSKIGWLGWVIILGVWYGAYMYFSGGSKTPKQDSPRADYSLYTDAPTLNYRDAMLQNLPKGTLVQFDGELIQVLSNEARISIGRSSLGGYSGDAIYLAFREKPKVIEGDIVNIKGRYAGTITYKSVVNAEVEAPLVRVDYYDVIKPRK